MCLLLVGWLVGCGWLVVDPFEYCEGLCLSMSGYFDFPSMKDSDISPED